MAFDRVATLRHAEKLLRQGKLDAAIAAYASVVEHQPTDWNTANTLGDLYLRVGQAERAVEQFVRSADRLTAEGFFAKAAAVYKKVLKLKPDDERALLQAGEVAAKQGLYVDARAHLTALAERRAAIGDHAGAADMRIRADTIDPNDYDRRMAAARLRGERGEKAMAVRDLLEIARQLGSKRPADAIAALEQAAQLAPRDDQIRAQLVKLAVEAGDFTRARAVATTTEELRTLADALESRGRHDEGVEILRLIARLNPGDVKLALRLARAFVARGDVDGASEFLTADTAHADPSLVLAAAELQLRNGLIDEGLVSVRRFLAEEVDGREQIAVLSCRLANSAPEEGFRALEVATGAAVGGSDWTWAVAALQEFTRRAPTFVPALLRLVETSVDAGLESALYDAQVRLTDAYLAAGAGAEARTLAEDLVDREPWEMHHIDRLRKAHTLLKEPDPDRAIAARLSAQTTQVEESSPTVEPITAPPFVVIEQIEAIDSDDVFGEVDLGEISTAPILAPNRSETANVDLSIALNDMAPIKAADLDSVFEQLRDEVSKRSAIEAADADYQRALALHRSGDLDACIPLLRTAARVPAARFGAASLLARIFRERGTIGEAIEWLECAAEATPPTPAAGHDILYELADTLESAGEPVRALAVWLELQTDAGHHRDVAARINRLANVKTRG